MSLIKLPEIKADFRLNSAQFDLRPDALERWMPDVIAAADNDNSISIYEPIGEDWWTGEGVTAKRISAALRSIGEKDVQVNINSPGGDLFEGVAIYNLLRTHKGKVTVNVLGIAASAASVIAMAGDEILMGDGAFLMIHNAWAYAVGNRHDMLEASERLEPFDMAMADVYSQRSGISKDEIVSMMDKETWINSHDAVEDGFATGYLEQDKITQNTEASQNRKPLAIVEAAMAKAGHSRTFRRETLKELFTGNTPGAVTKAMPCAGNEAADLLRSIKLFNKEIKGA